MFPTTAALPAVGWSSIASPNPDGTPGTGDEVVAATALTDGNGDYLFTGTCPPARTPIRARGRDDDSCRPDTITGVRVYVDESSELLSTSSNLTTLPSALFVRPEQRSDQGPDASWSGSSVSDAVPQRGRRLEAPNVWHSATSFRGAALACPAYSRLLPPTPAYSRCPVCQTFGKPTPPPLKVEGRWLGALESPTITREATATGVIMVTAAYMSREQARGNLIKTH